MTESDTLAADADYFAGPPPRRIGTNVLVQRSDGKYLLVVRNRPNFGEVWGMPGGSAGPNENPRVALARAISQRLGLPLDPNRLEWLGYDHVPRTTTANEGYNYLFAIKAPPGVKLDVSHYLQVEWVDDEDAQELLVGHGLRRFNEMVKAREAGVPAELLRGRPTVSEES